MADRLSALPAELSLNVLCHLSDLKALYAAVLASPRLWRIFRSNARHVFWTVVQSTMPDALIGPMVFYMQLRCIKLQNASVNYYEAMLDLVQYDRQEAWGVMIGQVSPRNLQNMLADEALLHVVAQAVRVHDLADFIVRTKLDYLATMQYREKQDSEYKLSMYWAIDIPSDLTTTSAPAIPSWFEENRAVRAMWVLNTAWRLSSIDGDNEVIKLQDLLRHFSDDTTFCMTVTEFRNALGEWPTLHESPPTGSSTISLGYEDELCHLLDCYPTPGVVRTRPVLVGAVARLGPVGPQFSRVPAQMPNMQPADTDWTSRDMWGLCRYGGFPLLRRFLGHLGHAYDTEEAIETCVRLGFDLWDRQRLCSESQFGSFPRIFRLHGTLRMDMMVQDNATAEAARNEEFIHLCRLMEIEEHRRRHGWSRWPLG